MWRQGPSSTSAAAPACWPSPPRSSASRPITALDHDPAAIEATLDNARANGVTLERVERHDLRTEPAPVAPVMTANLMRPLLLRVADLLPEQPETLIVSGLLEGEEEEVAAAFASLRERRRIRLQGWSALLLTLP